MRFALQINANFLSSIAHLSSLSVGRDKLSVPVGTE